MTAPRPPGDRLVRVYVVTGGRARPTRNTLDADTLLVGVDDPPRVPLSPEERELVGLLRAGPLSVAETAGELELPVSVTKVLVADLVDGGHLVTRAPVPAARPPDPQVLQEVLDALRARR
ncbi:DUF742 domain-containing protein [Streptomyces sp. NPDC086783]|uniref:DUF742 domain-containing protein n=1 Tax=Streptomyces sp. NPDC086783 TaxID=3365758 RepID=UPI00382AAE47